MKSLTIKAGVAKGILMVGGLFVGARLLIALLEQVALLFAYYLA